MLNVFYIPVSVGCMEDGTTLGDVELPPWAKGDPQEFIRIHREVSDPRPHQALSISIGQSGLLHTTTVPIRLNNVCRLRLMYVHRRRTV